MKLSLSTMWWGEEDDAVEELVRRTVEIGFSQVELGYRRRAETLGRLREAMARAGLGVSSLHAPFPRPAGEAPLEQADLAAEDAADRRQAVDLVARTLEEALRWGAGTVVLHAGNIRTLKPLEERLMGLFRAGLSETDDARRLHEELRTRRAAEAPRHLEWVREGLSRLALKARSLGVVIGLENRAEFRNIPSLEETGGLLEELGPTVGYWHDVGHAARLDALGFYRHEAWLRAYGDRLVGMHLHDCAGLTDHQIPGQGEVPFGRLAPWFPDRGLRVLEVLPAYSGEEIAGGLSYLRAAGVLP